MTDGGTTLRLAPPKILQALGFALVLCCVAVNRVRGRDPSADGSTRQQQQRLAKDLKRKRPKGMQAEVCEGLVDLIRGDEATPPEQEMAGPSMSRKDLARGLLVVVVIGPASTKVHQSYVVNKLLRYLRWSNVIRRHFPLADQDSAREDSDSANDLTDSEDVGPAELNGSRIDENGHGGGGPGGGGGADSGLSNGGNGSDFSGRAQSTHGYTFSDRGKAAALATIAVQDSAKKVASWLNGLSAGGVAVIEAGRSGWATTRHGRDALPGFLRQTTEPDLGVLWVELLPSGLLSRRRAEPPPFTPGFGHGSSSTNEKRGAWKSANGLPSVPEGPGENVVDTFLQSGNLVGAGGHVFYESVRRSAARGAATATSVGGGAGVGAGRSCFVSLAEQGVDVQSQLEDEACPLARRLGTFAGALKMKKSWHGCPVYLTRHGESLMNQTKSMGGDTRLSETGDRYAGVLADFVAAQPDAGQSRLLVWCSPMKRAVQTARAIKCHRYTQWEALTELDTGVFNGYSYKQVESEYPEEFQAREKDKLSYRYPEGEGYLDVVNRLDAVVVALEKEDGPVIVISHQAILRCLYAYFLDIPLRHMPRLSIPLHTVVKLTPNDYQQQEGAANLWKELRFVLIKQTPLEQLAEVATIKGGSKGRRASQLGESLS